MITSGLPTTRPKLRAPRVLTKGERVHLTYPKFATQNGEITRETGVTS